MMPRSLVPLVLALVLAVPTGASLPTAADVIHYRGLHDAQWFDGTQNHTGVTGAGIVALSTEGFDGTHPALRACMDDDHHALVATQPTGETSEVNSPRNDIEPHGDLVAGAFCANGSSTQADVVAPAFEASLHSFETLACSNGECDLGAWFDEGIRVVTNSKSSDPIMDLQRMGMPDDADILFLQAAGNDGGDGNHSNTDPWINDDSRLLGVAAATFDGQGVAYYSSRGAMDDPSTWPAIAAPGCLVSTMPLPWTHYYAIGIYTEVVTDLDDEASTTCPEYSPDELVLLASDGYALAQGTSFATPLVAGVAALMLEVNPALSAQEAAYLLTRTADPFLPTEDTDQDGRISSQEFYDQHGWEAGYGLVNATAAVAASHYRVLHPDATLAEAVECFTVQAGPPLVLNPPAPPCPASLQEPRPKQTPGAPATDDGLEPPAPAGEDGHNPASNATPASTMMAVVFLVAFALLKKRN